MTPSKARKWYDIRWYSDEESKDDCKLIVRLDLLIVPYAVLSYWVKYLDQANLSMLRPHLFLSFFLSFFSSYPQLIFKDNAYVAGLKEDLGFHGNELVQLQTFYIVGAVVGQLPFLFLFTYVPMYYLIPGMDVAWGIFTLLQFRTTSFPELAAYRFLVGLFEVITFPFRQSAIIIMMSRKLTSAGSFLSCDALRLW